MPRGVYQHKKGYKRLPFTEEHKRKIKLARAKQVFTEETRLKMSQNNANFWLGKKHPHSKETIEKIVKANKKNGVLDYFKKHKFIGENHGLWKGNKVGYDALHSWLYREMGQPDTCEFCGKTGLKGKSIHWANKSRKYKRNLNDWLRLCAKCHYTYDRK